jgi:hypothetical protein
MDNGLKKAMRMVMTAALSAPLRAAGVPVDDDTKALFEREEQTGLSKAREKLKPKSKGSAGRESSYRNK